MLAGCSKGEEVQHSDLLTSVRLYYKNLPGAPDVIIYYDGDSVSQISLTSQGGDVNELALYFRRDELEHRVRIDRRADHTPLLDTFFRGTLVNEFRFSISDLLGIRQFGFPAPENIPAGTFRLRLRHYMKDKLGEGRRLSFRFFLHDGSGTNLLPTGIAVSNLAYDTLSGPLDLPFNDSLQYCIKTYDAATDSLLIDISPGYTDGTLSDLAEGHSHLIEVHTKTNFTGKLFYDRFKYYRLD